MTKPEFTPSFQATINDSAKLLHQNRPGEAAALLEQLYKSAPTHPDLAINLGGAYILQRKWDRAVRVLNKAAEANPENVMLWINLGAAHLGNLETAGPKQQERAIRAYERALQVDAVAPNVHYHLGLIYKERGEITRAMAFFQRALEVLPTDRDARYWLDRLTQLNEAEQKKLSDRPIDTADGSDDAAGRDGEQL